MNYINYFLLFLQIKHSLYLVMISTTKALTIQSILWILPKQCKYFILIPFRRILKNFLGSHQMIVREMPKKISKYFPPKFYGNVGSVTSNIDPISSFYLFSISFEKKVQIFLFKMVVQTISISKRFITVIFLLFKDIIDSYNSPKGICIFKIQRINILYIHFQNDYI